jgi:hypothetical protein
MAVKEFPAGTQLIRSEQNITALHVIAKGTVRATYPGGVFYLTKGDVIGVCELFSDSYFISYYADDTVAVASYAYSTAQLSKVLRANADVSNLIVTSLFKQFHEIFDQYELGHVECNNMFHYLMDSYGDYVSVCTKHQVSPRALPGLESVTELSLEDDLEPWLHRYYSELRDLVLEKPIKEHEPDFLFGVIMNASQEIYHIVSVCRALNDYKADLAGLLMNESALDLFDMYANLLYKIGANTEDSDSLIAGLNTMMMQLEDLPSVDQEMYRSRTAEYRDRLEHLSSEEQTSGSATEDGSTDELRDSMNTILNYSGVDDETAAAFRTAIQQYGKLTDKNSSDDSARKLRLTVTKLFYQVYDKAFLRSVHDHSIPKVVKMFFNFGYVDENLAGMNNAAYLYSIIDRLPTDPEQQVYSIYEWLLAIYHGEKSPSRNEFDTDYVTFLREQRVAGKITTAEETAMQTNTEQQVIFELDNMFQSVNKITFGRISTFCPVFSEHNVLKALDASLVSAYRVGESFNQIRSLDYSAYYRDVIYTNPEIGIGKEYVDVEILPDVILLPNVGIRGVMWQEIEGRKRTTPARMMLSIFHMEDLTETLVRLTGDYRWEMCKRIQGARWNDVSEPSLTSEYFDYIQFYKKNRDLSTDAKDKIKLAMQKAKNSFKEMFIKDYSTWVLYEGAGSPRMNKISRTILFTYCPFTKEVRNRLKANPLYSEMMERYDIKLSQKLHHYDNLFQKLKNQNIPVPQELREQREYLER